MTKTMERIQEIKSLLKYIVPVLSLSAAVHIGLRSSINLSAYGDLIIEAYAANLLLTVISFISISALRKRQPGNLAYIFFYGSILKGAIYLGFFRPVYAGDNQTSIAEFLSFFIPYAISLIVEIFVLIRILRKD